MPLSSGAAQRQASLAATARLGVLFVNSPTRPPLGADTWIHVLLARSLDRAAFDVHAACAPGPPGARTPTFEAFSKVPNLSLRSLDFGPELFNRSPIGKAASAIATAPALVSLLDLALYVRRHRIRIVHTSDRPRDALACVLLSRLTGAKCVVQAHVAYGDWMSPALRWALVRADALVGVSQFVARSLITSGHAPERTHVVLNSIDPAVWDSTLDPAPVRRELGIPSSTPMVLSVARLFRAKGLVELVRATARARRDVPELRLVVVGEDYPPGNGHGRELRRLADELGIGDKVLFCGYRKDIASLMAACDIFALPSFDEPFGLVYAEAMAMKRPVVALDAGGAPEVVEHDRSGLLARPGDVDDLARHLVTLLRDRPLRNRMGEHGRRVVETSFTPERMARDAAQVYASLDAPGGGRR